MLSPGYKVLCIEIFFFLNIESIFIFSSLVHFMNCPDYLTRWITEVYIHLKTVLQQFFILALAMGFSLESE